MDKPRLTILIHPGAKAMQVLPGTSLLDLLRRTDLSLNQSCGGVGSCGKCRVRFLGDAPTPGDKDMRLLTPEERHEGWRLGCQVRFYTDAEVELPASSQGTGRLQIQSFGRQSESRTVDGETRKYFLRLPPPSMADNQADLLRLESSLREASAAGLEDNSLYASAAVLQRLGERLRAHNFEGSVTLRGNELIDFEGGDTRTQCYGIAFDIGTTSLVGALLHLETGESIAEAACLNPQTRYGDDVLSRIAFASSGNDALLEMQDCLLERIREMILQICDEARVQKDHVYALVFTGNTTMSHLAAGFSPASLGVAPFVPLYARGVTLSAADLALPVHDHAQVYLLPVISGFVGGDTVTAMVAAEIDEQPGPVLMVDIGTNGELVLADGARMLAASTAAGPAFEGARISCGMRAVEGAVEHINISDDVYLQVVGGKAPIGLCGSGLIDLCGELLKIGCLTADGRLLSVEEAPKNLPPKVARRLQRDSQGRPEFVFLETQEKRLSFTQNDARELQLAVAAIRAGMTLLLRHAGLQVEDLHGIYIAGGFGSYINRENAQRIALFPTEVHTEKIQFPGNLAFSGAQWVLLSKKARQQAEDLARRAEHIELSQDPDFALEFAMATLFPDEGCEA
ncbi:MAG: DUF4445 domain-containing protein [Candidatus Hydrogenedentes bacterium]|nr:DUF4445 domain-containing protein [Candidatus Hydrogenedentota bacterium]